MVLVFAQYFHSHNNYILIVAHVACDSDTNTQMDECALHHIFFACVNPTQKKPVKKYVGKCRLNKSFASF